MARFFNMKKTLLSIAFLSLVGGCDSDFISDPPVAVTLRGGVMSQYVLQVSNLTAREGIEVYIYAASNSDSARSGNIVIPANSAKEFGVLEMGWRFKAGDRGFVAVRKYSKKLYFEIFNDGRYKTWFGFNDIPEVDVASELKAKE